MADNRLENELHDKLVDALLALETREECYRFLDDLLTRKEIDDLSQRLMVAIMLENGRTYTDITAATGASSATIGRVNRAYSYGSDGYKIIIDRINGKKND